MCTCGDALINAKETSEKRTRFTLTTIARSASIRTPNPFTVVTDLTAVKKGRAGELLAAGIIEQSGYRAILCQQQDFDLLIMSECGQTYRCEVKTSSRPTIDKQNAKCKPRYRWSTARGTKAKTRLNPDAVDVLCLVALDIRRVYFKSVFHHRSVRTNLNISTMLDNDELAQLARVLREIDLRRQI
jgi:hypothetical protein